MSLKETILAWLTLFITILNELLQSPEIPESAKTIITLFVIPAISFLITIISGLPGNEPSTFTAAADSHIEDLKAASLDAQSPSAETLKVRIHNFIELGKKIINDFVLSPECPQQWKSTILQGIFYLTIIENIIDQFLPNK